jgi:CBS domain-containing protein
MGMFGTSWRVGRIAGIEIRIDSSWAVIALLITYSMYLRRIPPELSLQEAVDDYFMRYDHGAFPVEEQGRTIGLLTLRAVRRVPREQWPTRRVQDHMVPLGDQVVVAPDARMDGVLGKLQDSQANRVLVAQDGEVVGIITPTDLTRWLRRWRTLDSSAR